MFFGMDHDGIQKGLRNNEQSVDGAGAL